MRRSLRALERERKIEALIGAANQAQASSSAAQRLREVVEVPPFIPVIPPPAGPGAKTSTPGPIAIALPHSITKASSKGSVRLLS